MEQRNPNNGEFRHNIRKIDEIYKYGGEFYKKIIDERGGFKDFISEAYEGFEHSPQNLSLKRPNMTKIWNLPFNSGGFLYGSSLGHVHPKSDFEVQEIYEFHSYGGMLISSDGLNRLYVCRPCDKVVVPADCTMTILNFFYGVMKSIDMANPLENKSSKEIIEQKGPMIAFYHTGKNAEANHYEPYFSEIFGPKVVFPVSGDVKMKINKEYRELGIKDDEIIEFNINSNWNSLAENILKRRKEFERYNIEVIEGNRTIRCKGRKGEVYSLDLPLEYLVRDEGKKVHKLLGMI